MKKFNNIMMTTMAALTLLAGNINEVYAQDDSQTNIATSSYTNVQEIDWSKYAWNIDKLIGNKSNFYIYDTTLKKFVSTGGQYGVQPIAATSGMLFSIDKQTSTTGTEYRLKSNVINGEDGTGDCVGLKPEFDEKDIVDGDKYVLYIDRAKGDRVVWNFQKAGGTDNAPVYAMTSSWSTSGEAEKTFYLSYYQSATDKRRFYVEQADESKAAKFYFIDEATYNSVILDEEKDYIDVSNLIKDARFERMNKEAGEHIGGYFDTNGKWVDDYWKDGAWTFEHPEKYSPIGTNADGSVKYDKLHNFFINDPRYIIGDVMSYGTAWIGKEDSQVFYQEVKNIPAGYYRVNCQGFYKGEGLGEAYLFANDREVRLEKLTDDDAARFNETGIEIEHPHDNRDLYLEDMLRAGKLLADGDPYMDGTVYDNSVYVRVEATNGDGTGNIKLGIKKRSASGDAYVDNFKLYYCGTKEWYLNAANMSADGGWNVEAPDEKLNKEAFPYPVRYNLRRKFAVKKWNSFIVPVDIKGAQVKTAFSGETEATQVKVSRFEKINNLSDHIQIIFKKVDLDKEGITAGVPYIIWVGKNADVKDRSTNYSFKYGNSDVTVTGSIYHIDGIVPQAYDVANPTVSEGGVTFNGFYYKPTDGAPTGSYLLSGGDMYHLTSNYAGNSMVGTCWYMTIPSASTKKVSFSFEGENTPTAIEMVEMNPSMSDSAVAGGRSNNFIYNLSGQRVAMKDQVKSLKPGIYVCNGKKIIVR